MGTSSEQRGKKRKQHEKSLDADAFADVPGLVASPDQKFATLTEAQDHPPYPEKLSNKVYLAELYRLQIELAKMQRWVDETQERMLIIYEGRDAAGKGGAIARFAEHLPPRKVRHVALPKPNEVEVTQWYFQRYVNNLPAGGEIALFDRSWYNRAGVEPVLGFCTTQEYGEFLRQVPRFETMITNDGVRLFKLWFGVSRDEQNRRFEARKTDPLKQWKLSPTDEISNTKYDDYTVARDRMLIETSTADSPWTIINSNDKKRARLASIRWILWRTPYAGKDPTVACEPDRRVALPAAAVINELSPLA
jgi:polyphosphate kinase 2